MVYYVLCSKSLKAPDHHERSPPYLLDLKVRLSPLSCSAMVGNKHHQWPPCIGMCCK